MKSVQMGITAEFLIIATAHEDDEDEDEDEMLGKDVAYVQNVKLHVL